MKVIIVMCITSMFVTFLYGAQNCLVKFENDTNVIIKIGETSIYPRATQSLELSTEKSTQVYSEANHPLGTSFIYRFQILALSGSSNPVLLSAILNAKKNEAFHSNDVSLYKHR